MFRRAFGIYIAGIGIVLMSSKPAFAYIDPGTASIILQSIIGGSVAAASVVALYWRRFLAFFSGIGRSKKEMAAETDGEQGEASETDRL